MNPDHQEFKNFLDLVNSATITAISSFHHLDIRSAKGKSAQVNQLLNHFTKATYCHTVVEQLSEAEREVVNALLSTKTRTLSAGAIYRRLLQKKLVEPLKDINRYQPPSPQAVNSRKFGEIMARLLALGLVFGQVETRYGQQEMLTFNLVNAYTIPTLMANLLPDPPPEPAWQPADCKAPGKVKEGSARVLQRDLYLYYSYVRNKGVELTQRGRVLKRQLTLLNETLLERETIEKGLGEEGYPRLVFLRAMLGGLGALNEFSSALIAETSPKFFTQNPHERILSVFEKFTSLVSWNEFWDFPGPTVTGYGYLGRPLSAPIGLLDARRRLLLYFHLPAVWIGLDNFLQHIQSVDYDFLFPHNLPGIGYSPYAEYGNPFSWSFPQVRDEADGWRRVEGHFIHATLQALAWMGLVDLGYDEGRLTAFKLTAIGMWILAGGPRPDIPSEGGRVILQPNFTITAFDPVSDQTLMTLEQFAERGPSGRTTEFTLTQAAVYRGQRSGWETPRIAAFLKEVTGADLPGNVARTLEEWQGLYERITIYPSVTLIHAADPADLEKTGVAPEWAELMAPTAAVLRPDRKMEKVIQFLHSRNWLPRQVTQGERAEHFAGLDEHGRLLLPEGTLSFYHYAHLHRLADQDNEGQYHLTAHSVQRAVRSGLTAPQMIELLNALLVDPLPAEWEKRIIIWSGHLGKAAIRQTVLLRFEKDGALKELMQDAEIARLLHPLPPREAHTTLEVRAADLERLRDLLADRGVMLED